MEENNLEKPDYEHLRKQRLEIFLAMLKEMKNDGSYTDVVIVCDDKEFPAHKFILVATCSFFRDLFKSQFKESQTNRVEMPTIPASVMKIIIDFMYFKNPSEISNMTQEIAIETLKASHLLGYDSLWKECLFKIKHEICIENYKMIWDLSSLYEHDKHNEDIVMFLLDNLNIVLSDDQFLDLSTDQMLKLLEMAKENEILIDDVVVKKLLEWAKKDVSGRQTKLSELFGHINFNALSRDYLSFLAKEEPLIYNDREILLKFVNFLLPISNKEFTASSSKKDGIIACFLSFKNPSKYGHIQKVNLREQTKETFFSVPFPLTNEKHTIVRSNGFLYVVVDKRDPLDYNFYKYDIDKNKCTYTSYFRTSSYTQNIVSFIDHKKRCCIGNIDGNKKIYMYKEDISQWSLLCNNRPGYDFVSSMNINTHVYFLLKYNKLRFKMGKLKDNTINFTGNGFTLLTQPNLVTTFDGKFYLFEFENKVSNCTIADPLSTKWTSVTLDFYLTEPLENWKVFSRKESILFFSYEKTFEYYLKTHETIDVCGKTTHDLDGVYNTPLRHVYMWLE